MSGASWLRWSLAALMAAIALYHVVRLLAAHRRRQYGEADVDLTHAAMGSAMAMMLVGALTLRTGHFWALGFTATASWFTLRTLLAYVRGGAGAVPHPLRQTVLSGAMLLMLFAATTPGAATSGATQMRGMAMSGGGAGASYRGLVFLVAAVVAVVAIGTAAGLGGPRYRVVATSEGTLAPRMTAACQLAMNATTVYMLLLMA
jgi:hypothetical protein